MAHAFFPTAILLALCLSGASGPATAEMRRLEIEIEPVIILDCVDQVDYTIDTTKLLATGRDRAPTFSAIGTSSASARMIEARFAANTVLDTDDRSVVEVVIENACSVRGLGRGEGFLVEVKSADGGRLVNGDANGVLAVRDARGKPGYARTFARRFSIPQNRIRLDTAIELDVQLKVDMRYANGSGLYSSAVDGVFSIEVSAP